MSAATAILAAGHKRSMSKYAQFMHHECSYGVDGRHSEIEDRVRQEAKEQKMWYDLMSELTGVASQFWAERGKRKDFYLDADACLRMNIVDRVF